MSMYMFYYEDDEPTAPPLRYVGIWRGLARRAGLAVVFYGALAAAIVVAGWVDYL